MTGKIFGIGLAKTGTTSLAQALRLLGYRTVHDYALCESMTSQLLMDKRPSALDEYDAFCDWPHPLRVFSRLARFEGARFVLTTRDKEEWIRSCLLHVLYSRTFHDSPWRDLDTGALSQEWDTLHGLIEAWGEQHPGRALIFDISEGWEPLCRFLDRSPVPDLPFPHDNGSASKLADLLRHYRGAI